MPYLTRSTVVLLACQLLAVASACAGPVTSYKDLCDASAAIALGSEVFVVGDNDHNVLKIYRRDQPAATACIDLRDYLARRQASGKPAETRSGRGGGAATPACDPREDFGTSGAKAKEADIEGAARIGNRIYWIASHGRNSKGKFREERQRFFATDVRETPSGTTLTVPPTPPYTQLVVALVADRRFAPLAEAYAQEKGPEKAGGFNIEGLAATPAGHLLIGFRNPLTLKGEALLVPLTNPAAVIDTAAQPIFGDLLALDLGGRGIRSIESVGQGFVIVAGPIGNKSKQAGKDFALYEWSGKAGDRPQKKADIDFAKFGPEALFFFPGNDQPYVLSDDGDEKIDGIACKDDRVPMARKTFRGFYLDAARSVINR
ncbi:MAG: DUF3616 domain-containing protein [Candidatus Accumulibacter sp.]|nr:DUF3616 domain-containing protein [Accumulibacter sp.]